MSASNEVIVLVVEDETLVRLWVTEVLADAGFHVVEAPNADEAFRILSSRTDIRIVVTDVQMPGSMDGLKLARTVRDRWPPIEIVVLSGHAKPTPSELPSGGLFFTKPVDDVTLVGALRRLAA